MPFSTFTGVVANHAAVVGDDPGTTGTQFKTLLDKGVVDTKVFINAHIAELADSTDGVSATERLGSGTITGVAGSTPYAQMTDLKAQIDGVTLGSVSDNSITDAKLVSTGVKASVTALEKFPTAGGTGTALTVTCAYFDLVDGMAVTFVASASNGGAATTIDVESFGALSVYKPGGVEAPAFTVGKAYTIWYNNAGTCFFVKASAEGTAVAANVLAGTTASNDSDVGFAGTMVDRSGDTVALAISTVGTTIKLRASEGYRDGTNDNVTHTDANRIAANIKAGVKLDGLTGTLVEGTVTPGTSSASPDTFNTIRTTISLTYEKKKEMLMNLGGTYRVSFQLMGEGTYFVWGRIYKNGVAYGTERGPVDSSGFTFTEDLLFSQGDYLQIYVKNTTTNPSYAGGLRLAAVTIAKIATVTLD